MPRHDYETDAKNIKYLEPGQVHRIIDCIPLVSKHSARDTLLVELMWRTGARVSEAVVLTEGNIISNEFSNTVRLPNLKQVKRDKNGKIVIEITTGEDGKPKKKMARDSNATKEITVSKDFCQKLLQYCKECGYKNNDYVFPNSKSEKKHVLRCYVWRLLDKASRKANIEVFGKKNFRSRGKKGAYPHMLRHSNAMYLLEKTGNIRLAQQELGHASVDTTQVYAFVKTKTIEKQIEGIEW